MKPMGYVRRLGNFQDSFKEEKATLFEGLMSSLIGSVEDEPEAPCSS